jgi:hypothetical protein
MPFADGGDAARLAVDDSRASDVPSCSAEARAVVGLARAAVRMTPLTASAAGAFRHT